jgi:hypothetical protein
MKTITYRQHGDYLLPDIGIEEDQPSYGKYGMLRKIYLKNHKPGMYSSLLLSGRLNAHLTEIDGCARTMLDLLVHDYLQTHPAPDKATQQLEWVGYMNSVKHSMEEIVMRQCVYRD